MESAAMSSTMTLSLEPLSQALSAVKVDLQAGRAKKDISLGPKLQRLWQERGDSSKLTIAALEEDAARELKQEEESTMAEVVPTASTSEITTTTVDSEKGQGGQDELEEQGELEQALTPEQLWELKSNILEGLDLARVAITSALDLLQLYLNPLQALNPPVPEEALALPSGSFTGTALHTPRLPSK